MTKLTPELCRLILTAVIFAGAAGYCGYLAWTGTATTRPLWAIIAGLVAILGALVFECYRMKRP